MTYGKAYQNFNQHFGVPCRFIVPASQRNREKTNLCYSKVPVVVAFLWLLCCSVLLLTCKKIHEIPLEQQELITTTSQHAVSFRSQTTFNAPFSKSNCFKALTNHEGLAFLRFIRGSLEHYPASGFRILPESC